MEDITSWQIENRVDILDLERKLSEINHELIQKIISLEDVRKQLNAESAEKKELLIEVSRLNRNTVDIKIQVEAATKAFHTCEENLNTLRATSMRQKQQLDAALKTNDILQEQAGTVESENISLRNKVEELERQLRSNMMVKESCMEKQIKTHKLFDSLTVQVRNLEKDLRCCERLVTVATELGNKNKLLIEHNNIILNHNQEQKECLSKQVIRLSAENDILRKRVKEEGQDTIQKPNDKAEYMADVMQEWENSFNDIKVRATSETKECERLQLSLESAVEIQVQLHDLKYSASNRIKELEKTLQDERELHKKSPYVNIYQQTEKVHVVEVGCGSENKLLQHSQMQTEKCKQSNVEIQTDFLLQTERIGQCNIDIQTELLERCNIEIQTDLLQHSIGLPSGFESDNWKIQKSPVLEDISDWPTQKV